MSTSDSVSAGQLAQLQDRQHDVELLQQAIQCESVTGNEANFVAFLARELEKRNLAPQQADFLPGRPNLWSANPTQPTRPSLLFIGHTDTVHVRGWRERWQGDCREDPFGGAQVDGKVWGRGAVDLKGGICAALAALDLLRKADASFAGQVAYAFVGDEESGEVGSGVSAGMRDYSARVSRGEIAKPDFAIYVEPTELTVYTSQIGFFIADITVTGKSAYFGKPELGVDAIMAAHSIQAAIWQHAERIAGAGEHPLVGRSGALITEIKGGGYIAVPETCQLSLIRKLRPGEALDRAVAEFEGAVKGAAVAKGIDISIAYPAGRDHEFGGTPAEIDPRLPAVVKLCQAIGEVVPDKGGTGGAPYWSESPFLIDRIGCPAVYCAPGDIGVAHTLEEQIDIEQYLAAVRGFALFMHRFC